MLPSSQHERGSRKPLFKQLLPDSSAWGPGAPPQGGLRTSCHQVRCVSTCSSPSLCPGPEPERSIFNALPGSRPHLSYHPPSHSPKSVRSDMKEVSGKWEGANLSSPLAPLIFLKIRQKSFYKSENSSGLFVMHFESKLYSLFL